MARILRSISLQLVLLGAAALGSPCALRAQEYFDEQAPADAWDLGVSPASTFAEADLAAAESATKCDCPACKAKAEGKKPPGKKPYPGCKTCCHGRKIDWKKYPETIHPMPRPGIFPIAPTKGPGYYSLWDQAFGKRRDAAPPSGYAPIALNAWPFFDADWRYVEGIDPKDRTLVERLKRIHLNDCLMLSTGGEYWTKYHNEHNSRLTRTQNNYTLQHVRLYSDLWYSDNVRVYGEYIWADSFGESLAPVPPDVDRGDLQDLFVDLKLFEFEGRPVYVRGGRQELLYGSQRMITPLPWANKRISFDGVKVFRQGEKWDFDAFWMQIVQPNANQFDSPDENQNLVGAWLTHRPKKGHFLDFYYLMLNNSNAVVQQGIVRSPFHNHTVGSRWAGDNDGWLWDLEGMLQFGEQNHADLFAGAGTAGVGRSWKDASLKPTAWLYYDYASGDSDPNSGNAHTFNQLYPFGHYYLGWMDAVGRQNIHDISAHLYLYPQPWLTTWIQYHHFFLADSHDALYNAGGVAYRRDPTGAAGTNVGDEIDLVFNFHLTRYSDVLVSYNKLYGGGFLKSTAGATGSVNAESLYLIFQQRF